MKRIDAYLFFEDNCREAMTFYHECFGGELFMQSVGDTPAASHMPPHMSNFIMHASIKNENVILMASDNCMGQPIIKGKDVSLAISCNSVEELNDLFARLCAGGKVISQPKLEFWGDTFGSLVDRYGFNWMLFHNANQ
ncbi:VOC family protein [Mucilaginibacter sp. PAMB04168]|uniref:VOC family protein n=1 Tax=Mucilaginibacter sp. PAMB04168 TaxID=3138567 RepID=UPI0031F67064